MSRRDTIPDGWPNKVVHQKLDKYLTKEMAKALNDVDALKLPREENLNRKWAIVDAEQDSDAAYGGAIWITYQ